MSDIALLWKLLDTAIWELGEAFTGLDDASVWVRPNDTLLSIGEISCHIAHALAFYFLADDFASPLRQDAARYYSVTTSEPVQLDMAAADLYAEIERVYKAAKEAFHSNLPDLDAPHPKRTDFTWRTMIEYQTFHIPYHTGQIYSVRHLLGHKTIDN